MIPDPRLWFTFDGAGEPEISHPASVSRFWFTFGGAGSLPPSY